MTGTPIAAAYDNQILIFLTNFCEEDASYKSIFAKLYQVYQKNHGKIIQNPCCRKNGNQRWMSIGTFQNRLEKAGFELETKYYPSLHSKENGSYIVVHGVRPLEAIPPEPGIPIQEAGMMNDLQDGPYVIDVSHLQEPSLEECERDHIESSNAYFERNFIQIGNMTYNKKLVSTIRPIRPFQHNTTKKMMTHIITFNNPEMKHQFVDEEQAMMLKERLGV
jgi:hypothetical protein